jgi:hypothetical protein
MDNDAYLYHYTSNQNCFNIIETKKLWLSDCLKSNDKKEFTIIIEDILNTCKTNEQVYNILKCYINEIYEEKLDEYYSIYILCFSNQGDLLPQWHMYANNATGISIGFKKKLIDEFIIKLKQKEISSKKDNVYDIPFLDFFKIKYVNKEELKNLQINYMKEITCKINNYLSENEIDDKELNIFLDANMSLQDALDKYKSKCFQISELLGTKKYKDFNEFVKNEIRFLLYEGIKYKLSDFQHEEEWRICINSAAVSNNLKFNCSNDIFKAHIEFNLNELLGYDNFDDEDISDNAMLKIILGPKNLNSIKTIESFCGINEILSDVSKTNINYK